MKSAESIVASAVKPFLESPGNDVRLWPRDEAQAYRDSGGFQRGYDAAEAIRLNKASAAVVEALRSAGVISGTPTAEDRAVA